MPSAFLIVDTKLTNELLYERYKTLAEPIVHKYGGEYLARGGELHIDQEELWSPSRIVLIRFPNLQKAKNFLSSDEYQSVKAIRQSASIATLTVVEGI